MQQVEVEVIGIQPAQALLTSTDRSPVIRMGRMYLAYEKHPVAYSADCPADELFVIVHLCRINHRHSHFDAGQ